METLQRTANRGSISTGFDINNSVKLEDDNTEYLQRPASGSDGSRRTMTISMWLKRTEIDDDQIFISQGSNIRFRFKPNYFHIRLTDGSSTYEIEDENRFFRDTNAWYHLVVAIDTTQSTASNRVKIYWNGVQHTSFTTANYPSQNDDLTLGNFSSTTMQLGWFTEGGYGFNGYFAEVHYVDGTQVAQTEFGEFDEDSGIWKAKEYTGSHGSEGFYLKFEDSSNLGLDSSGNSNNFNLNNITAADQATDSPTNNFCTMNPLWSNSFTTYTEGATNVDTTGSGWISMVSNFAVKKGKWYWEFKSDSGNAFVGIVDAEEPNIPRSTAGYFFGHNDDGGTNSLGMYSVNGQVYNSPGGTPDGTFFSTSDIIGVAVDMDNYRLYYHKNGTYAGSMNPAAGTGGVTIPTDWNSEYIYMGFSGFNGSYAVNFGGYTTISISSAVTDGEYGSFEYSPPNGYYALSTKRLAEYG